MRSELLLAVLALCSSVACGGPSEGWDGTSSRESNAARSIWSVPQSFGAMPTFFDHPWPSDLRRAPDGSLLLEGFPNPRATEFLDLYIVAARGLLKGYSPAAPVFVRFEKPVDVASLPRTPAESLSTTSSVQLIDIDPTSPMRGARHPVLLQARNAATVYTPENTLELTPSPGHPLRPATRYALVVTDAARPIGGTAFKPSDDLAQVLGQMPARPGVEAAKAALAPAIGALEAAGIARSHIAQLSVFTTSDPTAETIKLRKHVVEHVPIPDADSWQRAGGGTSGVFDVFEGMYGPSPDYQAGDIPFRDYGSGGGFVFTADGTPILQREHRLRFSLSVPSAASCPMPDAGYPIVLYAHGTGGSYRSALTEARTLTKSCLAVMGIDQIFHGTRPGSDSPELLVFNIGNPIAARANFSQSAIDIVQQARLFTERKIKVPSSVAGREVKFDSTKVTFMGHSQGGINGPIFLAIDDQARGGVFSGAGAQLTLAFLEKKEPIDVALVLQEALALTQEEAGELDMFHPAFALAQNIADPADPLHYARLIAKEPLPGMTPKSILMTEGVRADGTGDTYTPPKAIEVHATAIGLPPSAPMVRPIAMMSPEMAGPSLAQSLAPITVPPGGLSGNIGGGQATGLLVQWAPAADEEGHFVIYRGTRPMQHIARFLADLSANPIGKVTPP